MSIYSTLQAQGMALLQDKVGEDVTYNDSTLADPITHAAAIVTNEETRPQTQDGESTLVRTRDVTLLRSLVANPRMLGRVTVNEVDWSIMEIVSQDTVRTIVRCQRVARAEVTKPLNKR
jgi:hypothetical protein